MERPAPPLCIAPTVGRLALGFCFEDLPDYQREQFAAHIFECDACWAEVRRIERAVSALRAGGEAWRADALRELNVLTGPSNEFEQLLGGHAALWTQTLLIYGLLHGLALFTEFAHSFDVVGWIGVAAACGIAVGSTLGALGALIWAWRRETTSRGSATVLIGGLVATTVAAAAIGAFILPARPLVEATFQTYPAPLGYAKTLFWTLLPALALIPAPFLFAIALQRELYQGRHKGVLMVLNRHSLAVPPPGRVFVRPVLLVIVGAAFLGLDFAGMSHVFDALRPGPHLGLFMAARWGRFALLVLFVSLCIGWYVRAIAELKREAVAGAAVRAVALHH